MSNRKETTAKTVPPSEYASNDGARKASEIGSDLAAVVRTGNFVEGSQAWIEQQLALTNLLNELTQSSVEKLDDVLALQVWANEVLDSRSRLDAAACEGACLIARTFQNRAMEALERISGISRAAFNGDERVTLN